MVSRSCTVPSITMVVGKSITAPRSLVSTAASAATAGSPRTVLPGGQLSSVRHGSDRSSPTPVTIPCTKPRADDAWRRREPSTLSCCGDRDLRPDGAHPRWGMHAAAVPLSGERGRFTVDDPSAPSVRFDLIKPCDANVSGDWRQDGTIVTEIAHRRASKHHDVAPSMCKAHCPGQSGAELLLTLGTWFATRRS